MIVKVDANTCQGLGLCLGLAPEVFDVAEDGLALVKVASVEGEMLEAARSAAQVCPTGAITLEVDAGEAGPTDAQT